MFLQSWYAATPFQRSGSNDATNFWRVAEVSIDAEAGEVYVADGYGNKRVAVLDVQTGVMKRHWGAYGNRPDDAPIPAYSPDDPPAQQFRSPMHCAQISHDGLVYACDRASWVMACSNSSASSSRLDGGTGTGKVFSTIPSRRSRCRQVVSIRG